MLKTIPVTGGEIACPLPNRKENERLISKAIIVLITLLYLLLKPGLSSAQIDPLEYPPGHPNVTVSVTDQLKTFPVPRYKTGHTMMRNFNWMDPIYFGSRFQPGVTDAQAVTNSVDIQTELAKNFNYYVNVTWSFDNFNTAWKNLANANPQWPIGLLTFRAQTGTQIFNQGLPAANYLQNSSGQFLDVNGNVTTNKTWRPTAPISSYTQDGLNARGYIQSALVGLTRNVDLVNEDGEVLWLYQNSALSQDPQVTAAKNASGLDWETFLALKVKENEQQAYRDQFMNLPQLLNAKYTQYRMDGQREWNFRWEQQRYVGTPINGQYYSTSDFYVRWPNNWKDWTGPWHGLKWMTESRHFEIAAGDKLYSPFVASGWDVNPETEVRPAQWLGLLKLLGMYGAEYYYTGYFNEQGNYNPPNPLPYDPKGYAWQAVMPPYSQAVTSRYEDILRTGSLMPGDMIDVSHTPDIPYYQFNAGSSNKVVAIRKKDTANMYAITGTIQNSSNVINSTPLTAEASITLNGQNLQFNIRRQGSTYIYDNTVPSAPVFYQLDGWHEATHPYRWTKDFNLEGELFDNTNSNIVVKTSVPTGTASGDFRNFTSYISFNAVADAIYNIQPRGTSTSDYYLWVRARSNNGTSTGFTASMDGGSAQSFDCITDVNWQWYRYNVSGQVVSYTALSLAEHQFKITPSNTNIEIDKISLVTSSAAVYTGPPSPCTGGTATITPGGPTTFCQGGNVTLSANSGTDYLWSTGATTQSITVSTSGSYIVTVTNGGTPTTSSPVTVTVNPLPSAVITPDGSLNIILGNTVTLTSSSGAGYLWQPGGQTTQSIIVGTAGIFTVTVTNSSGCSATSAPVEVIVTGGTGLSVAINAGGPTTFCQGGSVDLTASVNGAIYLWSTGATTQTITVTTSGTYTVTAALGAASGISPPETVTVNPLPGNSISLSGSATFCEGDSVILTADAGVSYLWSPGGETTPAITVTAGGTYGVEVTNSFGCLSVSLPLNVSVSNCTSCEMPVPLYSDDVTSNSATLHWSAVAGVDSLQLRLKDMNTGYVYITGMFSGLFTEITVGAVPNTTYRWRIRSKCGNLVTTWDWSSYLTYTTDGTRTGQGSIPLYLENDYDPDNIDVSNLTIYPNPASDETMASFQSTINSVATIKLLDFTGKVISDNTFQVSEGINKHMVDLKNYPKGIYLLMLSLNGTTTHSKKIVIH